jgi:hypothetical protein
LYGADDVLVVSAADEESRARAGGPPGIGIHTRFHRLALDGRIKLGPRTELKSALLFGRTATGGEIGDDIRWDLGVYEAGLRSDITHRFSKRLQWVNGVDFGFQSFVTSSQFPTLGTFERTFPGSGLAEDPGLRQTNENDTGAGLGFHSTMRSKLGMLTLIPGLRFDSYLWTGQSRLSMEPRLQVRLALAKKERHVLKASGGKYSQLPRPVDLSESIGNPELALKGAWQYGVGYAYRPDPFFHGDLTLFYKNMFHLIGGNPDYQTGSTEPRLVNNGYGRAYGLELMLRHRPSPRPIYGWIAYTLSRSERLDGGDEDEGWVLFEQDQTHILSSVLGYKWGQGWSFGVSTRWVTGTPQTPREAARFDVDQRSYRPVRGDRRSERRPSFFQTDIRFERKSAKKRNAFTWYVDVMNVTNRQNIEFFIYQYDQRAYSGIAGVPFFPSFGFEWSW